MFDWVSQTVHGLVGWTVSWAQRPEGAWALFAIAFAESSFFPIPPDVLLIALALVTPKAAFWFALICSVGSVLGGCFGYFLGWLGGRPLLHRFFSERKIEQVTALFEKYEIWAIAIAGFTPVPYKVFTIASGTFSIRFWPFLWASVGSRSARFFMVATAIYFWGEEMKVLIERYFEWFTLVFAALLIGGFVAIRFLVKHRRHPEAGGGPAKEGEGA